MHDDLVCLPWEGEIHRFEGVRVRVLVADGGSPGAWTLVEYSAPPRFAGPPPYLCLHNRETFYVLSGTLEVLVGEEAVIAPAGSCVVVPQGQLHTFYNREPVPVSFLIWLGSEELAQHLHALGEGNAAPVERSEYSGASPQDD